jgi:hypothetical protein
VRLADYDEGGHADGSYSILVNAYRAAKAAAAPKEPDEAERIAAKLAAAIRAAIAAAKGAVSQ